MVEGEELHEYLTTISNLVDKLEEVMKSNVIDKDFMTIVCFSIIGISRYSNVIKIIINGPILLRVKLINKLKTMKQQHKAANEKQIKLHTAMQSLELYPLCYCSR